MQSRLAEPPVCMAPRRPHRVCVLGRKGSGKETQAHMLAAKYGMVRVCLGELLRAACAKSGPLQQQVAAYLAKGALVPDSVAFPLVRERLAQQDCKAQGWVLEGFPRTLPQAQLMQEAGITPTRVAVLEIAEKVGAG